MKYSECLVSLFMCLEIGVTWISTFFHWGFFGGIAWYCWTGSKSFQPKRHWSLGAQHRTYTFSLKKILKSENPKTPWVKPQPQKTLGNFERLHWRKTHFFLRFPIGWHIFHQESPRIFWDHGRQTWQVHQRRGPQDIWWYLMRFCYFLSWNQSNILNNYLIRGNSTT